MQIMQAYTYTVKKGYYSKRELSLLATSLGFPSELLVSGFHARYAGNEGEDDSAAVSEKMVVRLLNSGVLSKKLEKVFNRYPAWYNVKSIRKSMQHIRRRSLSFGDISAFRIAFELYACEDGSGIPADLSDVLRALKMLERVLPPSQLQLEIQRFDDVSDVPSRLQLYEFMDIAAICRKTEVVEEERRLSEISLSQSNSGSNQELSVPDFKQILMTTDQKVCAYLESNYQQSRHGRPSEESSSQPPQQLERDHIVSTDSRKSLVSLGAEQSRAVTPCLEQSQSQLHRSRCGFYTLPDDHFKSFCLLASSSTLHHGKTLQNQHSAINIEDPLKKRMKNLPTHITPQKPVRIQLKHRVTRNSIPSQSPWTGNPQHSTCTVSAGLGKTINDICADSVIKARETLHSSMSVISPANNVRDMSSSVATAHKLVQAPTLKGHRCSSSTRGWREGQFHLRPIVTQEDREGQQVLVDELLWSTRRAKHHYQVIE